MKKQRFILLLVVAVMLIAIIAVYLIGVKKGTIKPFAASYPVTMSLTPATASIKVGSAQNVDIRVDNAGGSSYIASAVIQYNPNDFDVVDQNSTTVGIQITPGAFYPNVLTNIVDTSNPALYTIKYEASVNLLDTQNPTPVSGVGTLATIAFKAKQANAAVPATIVFTTGSTSMNSSGVSDLSATNLLTAVTSGNYNLFNASVVNVNLSLQGKTASNATNIAFTAYQPGTATVVYSKIDVATDATGKASFTATGLGIGTYDIKIQVPYFLSTKKANVVITDPATIDFGQQLAGDLNSDNQISIYDYSRLISIWRTKTGDATFNANYDIKQDGQINIYDYSLLISNWRKIGS